MESDFIAWLERNIPPHPRLLLGIGDDAAIVRLSNRPGTIVTTDLLTDEIDFRLEDDDPRQVGRKALAVNLSDLAAMAAVPVAAVVSLALPRDNAKSLAVELLQGMLPLAEQFNIAIAGGDTNVWDGKLVVSVTALGVVSREGPLRRSGARPGDRILVTGEFGGSILGKQFDFVPRIREAQRLHADYDLHAGTDVSDGLSLDLSHIANASRVGAVIHPLAVPISTAARTLAAADRDGTSPLTRALADGEDFELILAVPADDALRMIDAQPVDVPLTDVGFFVEEPGLWLLGADGSRQAIEPSGYQHGLS